MVSRPQTCMSLDFIKYTNKTINCVILFWMRLAVMWKAHEEPQRPLDSFEHQLNILGIRIWNKGIYVVSLCWIFELTEANASFFIRNVSHQQCNVLGSCISNLFICLQIFRESERLDLLNSFYFTPDLETE